MQTILPEDRTGIEPAFPPDWTIFDPERHEPPLGVLAQLDDLTGWTAEVDGLAARFGVTPAAALWAAKGAFVDVAPSPTRGRVTLRPPTPMVLPGDADLFELWVSGDVFDWDPKPTHFSLELLMKSANGPEQSVLLTPRILWTTYSPRLVQIPPALRGGRISGLRLAGHDPGSLHRFCFACLSAYRDTPPPIAFAARPRRPLRLPAGQTLGVHTGPGELPFPTREETILPDNLTSRFTTQVARDGDAILFRYEGEDERVAYRWLPARDALRLRVRVGDRDVGDALAGFGLVAPAAAAAHRSWVAPSWRTAEAMEPLELDRGPGVPNTLTWRGRTAGAIRLGAADTDTPTLPVYDLAGHGKCPVYVLFREFVCETEGELPIACHAPRENLALWLDGVFVPSALRPGAAPFAAGNGVWRLPATPGRHVLAQRVSYGGSEVAGVEPLPAGAAWAGPWVALGPWPHEAGAAPCPPLPATLRSLTLEDGVAVATFEAGAFGPLNVSMRLWGKSMVVDLECPDGGVAAVEPGGFVGLSNARVRAVPAMAGNAMLLADVDGRTVFFSHLHDWYRSNASQWTARQECASTEAWVQGQLLYHPRTDGQRNGLFERYFLTCSPVYEEVLPNIPNPPSPWAAEAGRYVFQESWGPSDVGEELQKARRFAAHGITALLRLHHERGWGYHSGLMPNTFSEQPVRYWVNDGCTLKLDVSPYLGGTQALRELVAAEQALGFRVGLYTNYTDYYPLNNRFSRYEIAFGPDGSRQYAWVHSYRVKPPRAVEYDAYYAPRTAAQFHPNAAYTDVHTCIPPWQRVDHDARVPGASTFAATYYADGELLLNDQRHYNGPVFSEGGTHWIYAGLATGNYGQIGVRRNDPPDPAFNLLKVHPLGTDIGLCHGPDVRTSEWIAPGGAAYAETEAQVDRYLMAILTFGHIAYLPEDPFDLRLLLRIYHMARAVTSRIAGRRPAGIRYQDDSGRWMSVSEAHARGLGDHCRVRVEYPGSLVFYANWSQTRACELAGTSEGTTILPPNGYLLDGPHGLLCASVLQNGARTDRAQASDGWFVDGRGRPVQWGPLTTSGCAALLLDPAQPQSRCLIDGGGAEAIRVDPPHAAESCEALDADARTLATCSNSSPEGWMVIRMVPGAVRYQWRQQ